ncbi:MAG TPA: hypothetical protein PKU71_13565 [bacterium]|nr:hypothetical protein [bacterium]
MKKQTSKKSQTKPLKKGDAIRCTIKHQGAPIINGGYVREIGENIVALEIDLKSKHCEVTCSFSSPNGDCGVYVEASERSLYLNEKEKWTTTTGVEFSDFVGWDVFACSIGRYTLRVCLIRKD